MPEQERVMNETLHLSQDDLVLHYYGEDHGIQKREVPAPEAQPQLEQKPEPQSEEVKSSSASLDAHDE